MKPHGQFKTNIERFAGVGVWYYHHETNDFSGSEEFYHILGIKDADHIAYHRLLEAIHPEDHFLLKGLVKLASIDGTSSGEVKILKPFGEKAIVEIQTFCHKKPLTDQLFYSGYVRDITSMRHTQEELLLSHTRYMQIFLQSRDAIFITKDDGTIVDFNDAATELFGYSRAEMRLINFKDFYKSMDDRMRLLSKIDNDKSVKDFELDFVRKDGQIIRCQVSSSQLSFGGFTGYHGILRDITDKVKAMEEAKAREIAERASHVREEFLAKVSHEIRTPMNAILGMSHLLRKTELNDEQHEYVEAIHNASENLLGIINGILDLSKIQAGQYSLKQENTDLRDILNGIISLFHYKALEKNIILNVDIDNKADTRVFADQIKIHQILSNLIGNAIKFTDSGNITLSLRPLSTTSSKTLWEITIEDSGIGLSEIEQQHIFDLFYQVESEYTRKQEGTGLGLTIVKRLVELMHGTISVASEKGKGTLFTIILPLRHTLKSHSDRQMEDNTDNDFFTIPDNLRILLVDDNEVNMLVTHKIISLTWPNIHVETAEDGYQAISKIASEDYDIVLMDIQMPVMNGFDATRWIRTNLDSPKCHTPVIAFTAHADIRNDSRFKDSGITDVIVKPFRPDGLLKIIARVISQKTSDMKDLNNEATNDNTVNIDYLSQMVEDDPEIMLKMLDLLLQNTPKDIDTLIEVSTRGDIDAVRNICHKLKTTLSFLGNPKISKVNEKIHIAAKKAAPAAEISGMAVELKTNFESCSDQIRRIREEIIQKLNA